MLTIEITIESIDEYLQVLAVLDRAEEDGKLDFEWAAGPALISLPMIAEDVIAR